MAEVSGGEKAAAIIGEIVRKAGSAKTLRVGFLSRARYPDGTPVALVAAVQNYGAPSRGIPPRPFMSNMVRDKSPTWPGAIANLLVKNGYDVDKTLKQAGEGIAGQLRQSIIDTNEPALAPATVKRKGSTKALVDTGNMLNSIDWEVK